MTEQPAFWFADTDESGADGYPWTPFLQLPGWTPSLTVWFATRRLCEDFIASNLAGEIPLKRG